MPMLQTFGSLIVHLGPLGTGAAAKIANNALFMAILAVTHDTVQWAQALGVDREPLLQALGRSSGGSFALGILERYPDVKVMAAGPGKVLRKDALLARALGESSAVPEAVDVTMERSLAIMEI
jgi:3-hydroxyisobutyrate dehydrogenase-like beta-hydroxyacid dehydrogenase